MLTVRAKVRAMCNLISDGFCPSDGHPSSFCNHTAAGTRLVRTTLGKIGAWWSESGLSLLLGIAAEKESELEHIPIKINIKPIATPGVPPLTPACPTP